MYVGSMPLFKLEWRRDPNASWHDVQLDSEGYLRMHPADVPVLQTMQFRAVPAPAEPAGTIFDQLKTHAVKPSQRPQVVPTGPSSVELPANEEDLAGFSFDVFWRVEKLVSETTLDTIGHFYDEHSATDYAQKNPGWHGLLSQVHRVRVITKTGTFIGWPITLGTAQVSAARNQEELIRLQALAKLTPEERRVLGV